MIPKQEHNNGTNTIRKFNFVSDSNTALANNHKFQFAKKHSLSLYRQNTIYTFIPKNGCTTLRASVASANGFIYDIPKQINWIHSNSYTFSASLRELATADYTFTVLRCPYNRLASLFIDKFIDRTPVAWSFLRLNESLSDIDDISFEIFIKLLSKKPNLINADIHWQKQSDFLIYQNYDDYFRFEDFTHIENTLQKKIGLEIIDCRNITRHGRDRHNKILDQSHSKTTVSKLRELKLKNLIPSTESLFTEELRSLVDKLYLHDFKLLDSL